MQALGAVLVSGSCTAVELSVNVIDRQGHGVSDVVVVASPIGAAARAPAKPAAAIMDQMNRTFVPGVLVVATGSQVEFPNNDTVSHQVYSFSRAKRFQLPLYKGEIHPPVTFDQPGLVVLGCNIHDQMVGYIYVTDAPYFAMTAGGGAAVLGDLPAGDYQLTLWSPFIADPAASLTRKIHLGSAASGEARVQLERELRTRPEPRPRRSDWEY